MYAIVRTGGKQYRVEEGRSVVVERLPAGKGETVELHDVLLLAQNGNVTVGTPIIEGARVLAEVESHGRAKKIAVFKYKAKVRARTKTGHRQHFTKLSVLEILAPGQESKAAKPKRRRAKAEEAEAVEAIEAAEAEAPVEAPEAAPVEPAAPKRRTRRAAPKPKAEAEAEKPKATRTRTRKPAAEKADKGEADAKPKPRARRPAKKETE